MSAAARATPTSAVRPRTRRCADSPPDAPMSQWRGAAAHGTISGSSAAETITRQTKTKARVASVCGCRCLSQRRAARTRPCERRARSSEDRHFAARSPPRAAGGQKRRSLRSDHARKADDDGRAAVRRRAAPRERLGHRVAEVGPTTRQTSGWCATARSRRRGRSARRAGRRWRGRGRRARAPSRGRGPRRAGAPPTARTRATCRGGAPPTASAARARRRAS